VEGVAEFYPAFFEAREHGVKVFPRKREGQVFIAARPPRRELQYKVLVHSDHGEGFALSLHLESHNIDIEVHACCEVVDLEYEVIDGCHL
jgi:hypothetical protein